MCRTRISKFATALSRRHEKCRKNKSPLFSTSFSHYRRVFPANIRFRAFPGRHPEQWTDRRLSTVRRARTPVPSGFDYHKTTRTRVPAFGIRVFALLTGRPTKERNEFTGRISRSWTVTIIILFSFSRNTHKRFVFAHGFRPTTFFGSMLN